MNKIDEYYKIKDEIKENLEKCIELSKELVVIDVIGYNGKNGSYAVNLWNLLKEAKDVV